MTRTAEEIRAYFAADRFAMEQCGIRIDDVQQGCASCSMPLTPQHMNAGGFAQGGAIFTLVDTCFAVAANAGGVHTVSQGAQIHYLRPGAGECLYARAECISAGRATCLYRVEVKDADGHLVAYATVNGFSKPSSGS